MNLRPRKSAKDNAQGASATENRFFSSLQSIRFYSRNKARVLPIFVAVVDAIAVTLPLAYSLF